MCADIYTKMFCLFRLQQVAAACHLVNIVDPARLRPLVASGTGATVSSPSLVVGGVSCSRVREQ